MGQTQTFPDMALGYWLLSKDIYLDRAIQRGGGQSQAKVTWWATFEADGLPVSEAVALLEGALQENCLALKRFIEAGRQ